MGSVIIRRIYGPGAMDSHLIVVIEQRAIPNAVAYHRGQGGAHSVLRIHSILRPARDVA